MEVVGIMGEMLYLIAGVIVAFAVFCLLSEESQDDEMLNFIISCIAGAIWPLIVLMGIFATLLVLVFIIFHMGRNVILQLMGK